MPLQYKWIHTMKTKERDLMREVSLRAKLRALQEEYEKIRFLPIGLRSDEKANQLLDEIKAVQDRLSLI